MQRIPRLDWRFSQKTMMQAIAMLGMAIIGGLGIAIAERARAQEAAVDAAALYVTPSTYTPPPAPTEVAFLGDSYTEGGGAEGKINRWTTIAANERGWLELNYGYGGTNFNTAGERAGGRPYYERLTDIVVSQPDIVIVSSAGNAVSSGQSAGIQKTFRALRQGLPDAEIYATEPMFRAGDYPRGFVAFGEQIEEGVEAVGGKYLELDHPLGHRKNVTSEDGVHPNKAGHKLIADAVLDALDDTLN